ncbi:MAG: alpha-ketoglutarate-dependent dioxygenase AlkB [Caulobacteraceae bacterium]
MTNSLSRQDIQSDLFEAPAPAGPPLPPGFGHWPAVVSPAAGTALAERLATLPFRPYEFQGYLGNRRVVSFGYRYNQARRVVEPATPLPDFLLELRGHVAKAAGLPPQDLVQALVNEYEPGAGIGWHRDRAAWDQVLGLSLLTPCKLRLRRKTGARWDRASVLLEPGSLYRLSGEVREEWQHSIVPLPVLRYSITFRTLADPKPPRP